MRRRRSSKSDAYLMLIIIFIGIIVAILKGIGYIINSIIEAVNNLKIKVSIAWSNPETKKTIIMIICLVVVSIILIILAIHFWREKLLKEELEKIRIQNEERIKREEEYAKQEEILRKEYLKKIEKAKREEERRERERLEKEYQHGYRDDMTGYEYEAYCTDLFKYFSWKAETTKKSGDFGADVIAKKDGIKIVAQCKKWKGSVGFDAVKEVFTAKTINKADYALVITNSHFSEAAKKGAKDTGVILIRHPELEDTLKGLLNYELNNQEKKETF